jgi:hypothetical protein
VDAGMTNQDVLGLVDAKVAPATIINQIRSAPKTSFDLSTAGIIALTKGAVPGNIIEVMRNPKAGVPVAQVSTPQHPISSTPPPPTKSAPAPSTPEPVQQAAPPPVAAPVITPPSAPQPAPAAVTPAAPVQIHTVSIPDGKPFNLTLSQDVPLKLTAGQKINFTVTHDVKVGDVVVIAKGTTASGEVVDPGDGKKLLGIVKGKATFKLNSVDSTGGRVNIRSTPAHTDKGDRPIELQGSKTKDLLAPAGAEYMAYIDNEQTVTIKR